MTVSITYHNVSMMTTCHARDAITPNQDWIISPHSACQNLYIATAGSFHGWKFLPILGAYVLRMLRGNLTEEQARRWSWDRHQRDGGAHEALMPKRDLKDIEGFLENPQFKKLRSSKI